MPASIDPNWRQAEDLKDDIAAVQQCSSAAVQQCSSAAELNTLLRLVEILNTDPGRTQKLDR